MTVNKIKLSQWLEWAAATAALLVCWAAVYQVFFATPEPSQPAMFSQYQQRATMLGGESDPIKRDSMCIPLSAFGRSLDAQLPTNSRVFLTGMLGPENAGKGGYLVFLSYYLYPRPVDISLGQPPFYGFDCVHGRDPASADELARAGYDLVLDIAPSGQLESHALKPISPRTDKPPSIPEGDAWVAFFLPLVVALAGTRLLRCLFKELELVLSFGELMACGLAIGLFFLTQSLLALRMAGARLEIVLGWAVVIWAVAEAVLLFRRGRASLPPFDARQLWWLLMIPAALMLWCLFRLAGIEGLLEFDAVAFWAFKAKVLYSCAGPELWTYFRDPNMVRGHLDYPLTVPLMHAFTYGMLGHVNEFATKFWNQWMLLLLGAAIFGAGKFPRKKPWLIAAVATVVILLPFTLQFTRAEGGTIPMTFYTVIGSLQLALGMAEKQPGRIRLGLLLLMAAAMVKFEGIVVLGFWGILLLQDKDSRAAIWPLRRIGAAGLLAIVGWIPYLIFRLHHPIAHSESAWAAELVKHSGAVLTIAPMTFLAFLSRRFLNNDFASWGSPDNQHAVWQGKWAGLSSLIDQATLGLGWVCLLLLLVAWVQGGSLRWTVSRLALVFLGFALFISVVWSSTHAGMLNYAGSMEGSERITGGRYLYPVLMSWFVAGFVLLVRAAPDKPVPPPEPKAKPSAAKPGRRRH